MSNFQIIFQASILKDTYLGDVQIFSPFHAGTETMYGFNLHLREPDVTYVAMTPYNFFEFIPIEDIEKDKPSVKLAHEVIENYIVVIYEKCHMDQLRPE